MTKIGAIYKLFIKYIYRYIFRYKRNTIKNHIYFKLCFCCICINIHFCHGFHVISFLKEIAYNTEILKILNNKG